MAAVENDRLRPRGAVMRCEDCGLALHSGAILHDKALVLASVCPRCDGTLIAAGTLGVTATPDPSIYLG